MKFAFPCLDKKICAHFGHCQEFAFIETDENNNIVKSEFLDPPEHQPGVYPKWVASQGANIVIGGGMGSMAQNLFTENGVEVVVGAPEDTPENVVKLYLEGKLQTTGNACDH
jgi:ATP-binding protein involved in chromosome partitioning